MPSAFVNLLNGLPFTDKKKLGVLARHSGSYFNQVGRESQNHCEFVTGLGLHSKLQARVLEKIHKCLELCFA